MLGDPSAPVTIIEFSDFTCTYCQLSAQQRTRQRILEQYPQTVRWIYRSFPAAHPEAEAAAEAAQCAYEQDKFWSYQDALYQNQARLAAAVYFELAQTQGLDTARFYRCMREGRYKAIALDASAAVRYNVRVLHLRRQWRDHWKDWQRLRICAARINQRSNAKHIGQTTHSKDTATPMANVR